MAEDATQPQADEQTPATPAPAEPPVAEPETETTEVAPSQESDDAKTEPTETAPEEKQVEPAEEPEAKAEVTPEEKPGTEQEQPKASRKERRNERQQRYADSIRRDGAKPAVPRPESYQPLPYEELVTEDGLLDTKAAQEDRESYAKAQAEKAAQTERIAAEQDQFRQSVELEKRTLEVDPKYSFLKEDSENFDPELTEAINDRFMSAVGYREVPVRDQNTGQVQIDANGNPVVKWYVERPDISYEKFAKAEVALWDRIAEDRAEVSAKNTASQKATQGARPSGANRAADISNPSQMTAEEIKKNEPRINDYVASLPPR